MPTGHADPAEPRRPKGSGAARHAAVALALLTAALALPSCASVLDPPGTTWTAVEAHVPGPADAALAAGGWACGKVVDLPAGVHRLLALCRRAAPSPSGEWHLVLLPRAAGSPPQVLSRLADASNAELRLFAPAVACTPGPACLSALALIDQRDEGSCYGTQVVAVMPGRPALSLGFINEWTPSAGASVCVGPVARVAGTTAAVDITLPGPLARTGRDGNPVMEPAPSVRYRVTAARPALARQTKP